MRWILSLSLFAALAASAFAQQSDPAAELFRKIWSPYCPGVSLMECGSSNAEVLRDQLRQRLKNGESPDALLKEMYQKFGTRLRMEPEDRGRESLAYWIPWLSIFVAAFLVAVFWMRRKRKLIPARKSAADKSSPPPIDPSLQKKILSELSERL